MVNVSDGAPAAMVLYLFLLSLLLFAGKKNISRAWHRRPLACCQIGNSEDGAGSNLSLMVNFGCCWLGFFGLLKKGLCSFRRGDWDSRLSLV